MKWTLLILFTACVSWGEFPTPAPKTIAPKSSTLKEGTDTLKQTQEQLSANKKEVKKAPPKKKLKLSDLQPDMALMIPDEEIGKEIPPKLTRPGKKRVISNNKEIQENLDIVNENLKVTRHNIKTIRAEIQWLEKYAKKNRALEKKLSSFLKKARRAFDKNENRMLSLKKDREIATKAAQRDQSIQGLIEKEYSQRIFWRENAQTRIQLAQNYRKQAGVNLSDIKSRIIDLKSAESGWEDNLKYYEKQEKTLKNWEKKYKALLEQLL